MRPKPGARYRGAGRIIARRAPGSAKRSREVAPPPCRGTARVARHSPLRPLPSSPPPPEWPPRRAAHRGRRSTIATPPPRAIATRPPVVSRAGPARARRRDGRGGSRARTRRPWEGRRTPPMNGGCPTRLCQQPGAQAVEPTGEGSASAGRPLRSHPRSRWACAEPQSSTGSAGGLSAGRPKLKPSRPSASCTSSRALNIRHLTVASVTSSESAISP